MGEGGRGPRKHAEHSGKRRYLHSEVPCLAVRLPLVRKSVYEEETRSSEPVLLQEGGRFRKLSASSPENSDFS